MGRARKLVCFVISILFLLSSPFGHAIAAPLGPGALVNGDFESSTAGGAVGTGWTAFGSTGYGAAFAVVSDQVHAGSLAQLVRSPQPTSNDKYAGVYQVVGTVTGQPYTVRAWNRTQFSRGNAWDYIARLGIDLTGGTSFEAPTVNWYEFDSAKNVWLLLEKSVTATGGSMTIFLEGWRKWPAGGDSYAWFDDVQVLTSVPPINHAPTAVATASPTSGPTPLAVAFSGTGSSDPDGDALTYTWSFGDGAQGSGATVSHTYSAGGAYTATLTVDDAHGGTGNASVAITVQAAASPLVNGDFESSTPGSALGTGWIAFSSSGYVPTFAVVSGPDQVHGGSLAQRVTSPQPSSNDKFSGVYQVVATTPGLQYRVRAWNRTHFTGGSAWDHIARLGIDLNGGNDFQASSVQWLEFDSAKDAWHPLEEVVTATRPSMTIYLESWRKWASGGDSLTWFDDVQVGPNGPPGVNHAPKAVAAANPGSGTAPLAVVFNGGGSTDPDGDPLTYAWTFGDGTQGAGVTVSHTYSTAGTYHAALTVDDGRGGTHSAELTIVVDPPSGNRPPIAVISANPKSGTIPFTVTLDASGSSDADGDPLIYGWRFADGVQGTGPTIQRTFPLGDFHKGEGPERYAGGYLVTLTVTDTHGATGSASLRIAAFPQNCPDSLDFDAKRAELAAQGKVLAFVKVGFHARSIDNQLTGLGHWERCLDAAGVSFALKSVDNAGRVLEGTALKATSGVPHTIIYRRSGDNACGFELPCYDNPAGPIAEAEAHWQLHLQDLPDELKARKDAFWIETINEPDKGRSEWLAEFSLRSAELALAAGYNYAAFSWAGGTPEPEAWDGPKMREFLQFAAQHPDRVAIALHEYNFWDMTFKETYPILIGRFTRLYEQTDAMGLPRPTVLVTEFAYPAGSQVGWAMNPDNIPWAASLYAQYPRLLGATIYDEGSLVQHIARMTEFALGTYFTIP